jgi:hypothetical protein
LVRDVLLPAARLREEIKPRRLFIVDFVADLFDSFVKSHWSDYAEAGFPYGNDAEGLLRWLDECNSLRRS